MPSSAYRELFRIPGVRWQALGGFVAQLTQGASGIGIILVVRSATGSLALGGAVVGALSLAAGFARPIQGRVIDRRGSRAVMVACGVVHPSALAGIVGLAHVHAPGVLLVALGALSGAALPPVSTSMRVEWGLALAGSDRTAAYSLVYLCQELSILVGPLILSAVIAAANASLALIVVAALSLAGTLAFAALLPGRRERSQLDSIRPRGVLREPGMRALVGIAVLVGAVAGGLEVAAPTVATAHHAPAASGLLIAALSIGGIVGAAIYGSRRWRAPPGRRLVLLLAGLTTALGLTIPTAGLVLLGALLLLAGLAFNPSLTTISLLVDPQVSPGSAGEAFGWLSFGLAGGTGAASAITAALTRPAHPQTAFLITTIFAAGATAVAGWVIGTGRTRASR